MSGQENQSFRLPSFSLRALIYTSIFPLGVLLIFFVIRGWFAAEPPLVVVNTLSSQVAFTSSSQQLAVLPVRGAVVVRPDEVCDLLSKDRRLTALIRATEKTLFEYQAVNDGVLVALDAVNGKPNIEVESNGHSNCRVTEPITLVIPTSQLERMAPLPVVGLVEIGSETVGSMVPSQGENTSELPEAGLTVELPPANVLVEASAQVFARTSRTWDNGRLVPVDGAGFRIPRGSRLASSKAVAFGNSIFIPESGLLSTEITLSALDLVIFRAGTSEAEESFAVGAMSRAFGDPTLAPLLIAFAVAGFLTQVFLAIQQSYRDRNR